MPKLALDQDAIKGFFIQHCEKIVLAVVLLLFAFFVYSGYSLEGLDSTKTPDKLSALSSEADGHIVTPGFVDLHTHLDAQIGWEPMLTPLSWHGVTTVVMGNCRSLSSCSRYVRM